MSLPFSVVTGGDSRLLGAAAVFFLSLKECSPELYEHTTKYFFVSDRSRVIESDIKIIASLGVFIKDLSFLCNDLPVVGHFSKGLASKLMPFLFQEQNRHALSLWFDVDQINIRDLSPLAPILFNKPASFILGGAPVESQFHRHKHIQLRQKYPGVNFKSEGVCGSFYAIRDVPIGTTQYLLELYSSLADSLFLGEQGVLDIAIQERFPQENLVYLPNKIFTPHPTDCTLNILSDLKTHEYPYFIHSYGAEKFWTSWTPHPIWFRHYNRWLRMGGSQFAKVSNITGSCNY